MEAIDEDREAIVSDFIKKHPNTIVSAYAITRHFLSMPELTVLEAQYNSLAEKVQQSTFGKQIKEKIDIEKLTAIGKYAPEFTQNDTLGNPVSLSSFKGKYVLIDFWASWCVPCRAENPNVVNAYNTYQDKGFTVLGVSLDMPGKKQSWLDAIRKDGLPWTQVSDLEGWKNAVAQQYNIQAVPANLLLDKDGVIIAKNLHGDALQKKLEEVIK